MTMMRSVCIVLALVVSISHAWVLPKDVLQKAAAAATVSAALLTAPLVSHASQFDGSYSDPKHPNCLRAIEVVGGKNAKISGTDGTPGCPADGSGKGWNLVGKVQGDSILVDFTPKGGPPGLKGVFVGDGIEWPDGNKWSLKK